VRAVGQLVFGLVFAAKGASSAGAPVEIQAGDGTPAVSYDLYGAPGTAQFFFKTVPGADYAVGIGYSLGNSTAQLFAPNGSVLGTFGDNMYEGDASIELHGASGGYYTLKVTSDDEGSVWVWTDCRGGPATKCTIAPGKTKAGTVASHVDQDTFLIKAPAGRIYTASAGSPDGAATILDVVSKTGRILVSRRGLSSSFRFKLPLSGGPYFLRVSGYVAYETGGQTGTDTGHYSLTLKQQ
jgi:hypothetical protein